MRDCSKNTEYFSKPPNSTRDDKSFPFKDDNSRTSDAKKTGAQESVSLLQPHLTKPGFALLGLGTGPENSSDYFLKHAIKKDNYIILIINKDRTKHLILLKGKKKVSPVMYIYRLCV